MSSPVGESAATPPAGPGSFAEALAAMSDEALAALLRRRPDVAVPPPADFDVLASRLSSQHSVSRAAETLDRFVLQLLEALVLAAADEAELAACCRVDREDIDRATDTALRLGLVWRAADGRLIVARGVSTAVGPYPCGLGRPFATLLAEIPKESRAQLRDDLGLPTGPSPTDALMEFFADRDALGEHLASLNEPERLLLTQLASGTPVGHVSGWLVRKPLAEAENAVERLMSLGLVVAIDPDALEQPREVGLLMRGDKPAGEIDPHPPDLAVRRMGGAEVDAGGAAAAMDALRSFESLLQRWDEAPPALTRAGGLPVRELRGASKDLGIAPEMVALIVETAVAASLAGRTAGIDPVMAATERYDKWRDWSLAERWALLATAWVGMDQLPGLAVAPDGTKAAALLTYDMVRPAAGELRRDVLAGLAAAGRGCAPDPQALLEWLRWRAPTRSESYAAQVSAWTLAEAQFLGVTGRGALTSAGRALLDADDAAAARAGDEPAIRAYQAQVAAALAPALPAPIEHLRIQADLTAVAPGPLLPPIARELAVVADVESAGAATVYRFSEASLRRAFDRGRTAPELHSLIKRLARGSVPQGLTYLIDDIARRHGRLRAGSANGYLRCDDPNLLAEVVANRRTSSAALVTIAPTVAVSPLEPAQILAVLRSAGYAPAGDTGLRGGAISLEATYRRRVPVSNSRPQSIGWAVGGGLPDSHIRQTIGMLRRVRSLRAPGRIPRPTIEPDQDELVRTPEAIARLLREAATDSSPVWIAYVNAQGRSSQRTVYPTLVSGGFVIGLDDESGERRTFALSRIQEAAPA